MNADTLHGSDEHADELIRLYERLEQQLTDKERENGRLQADNDGLVMTLNEMPQGTAKYVKKLRAKLAAQSAVVEAVKLYRETKRAQCTHGHPAAAFADGCSCFDCDDLHDKAWAVVASALDKLQGGE